MTQFCLVYVVALIGAITAAKQFLGNNAATQAMEDELTAAKGSANALPDIQFPCSWHGKTFDAFVDGVLVFNMTFDSKGDFFFIGSIRFELVYTVGSFLIMRINDTDIVFCSKVDDIQSDASVFYLRNGITYGGIHKPEKITEMQKICKVCRVNADQTVFEIIERGSGIDPSTTYDKDFCDTPEGCNVIGKGDRDSIECTDNGSLDFANC